MTKPTTLYTISGAMLFVLAVGCNDGPAPDAHADSHTDHGGSAPVADAHAHEHPTEGPHHGHLIELGKEEFHAELVHDKAAVTIYLLDAAAKTAVAIESTEVVVNLKHDGKPEQFKLAAAPLDGETGGKSSRFQSTDAELAGHLDDAASEPRLNVTIDGTPYTGSMSHVHDDHDHAHDDHKH
jgi:hypothetical protein